MHKGAECYPMIDCPKHLATVVANRPCERGRILGLWEAGRTYRRIAAHIGHNVIGGVSLLSEVICGIFLHP